MYRSERISITSNQAPTSMLAERLIPVLSERFSDRGLRQGMPPEPYAVFPTQHSDFGDLEIYDNGDELIVIVGNFTHGHFSNYNDEYTAEEKSGVIIEEVVRFIDDLFSDRVVVWGSHQGFGGWYYPEHAGTDSPREGEFLWSGPHATGD